MTADNIYKRLFDLLTTPHGGGVSALASSPNRALRRELLLVARKEQCLPDLYAQWDAAGALSPTESAEQDLFARDRDAAAAVARALPDCAVLLGGAALGRFWPQPVPRLGCDLEVMLPDLRAVGALHEAVKGLGLRLRGAGDWQVPLHDPIRRARATYRYRTSIAFESSVELEVHVGGVPVDGQRVIAFADLVDDAAPLEGHACLALHPTRQLLQLVGGFAAAAEPVTVRQLADVHHLLQLVGPRIDHAQLRRRIAKWGLEGGLAKLREAVVAKRLSRSLDWGDFGRLVASSTEPAPAATPPVGSTPGKRRNAGQAPQGERLGALVKGAFGLVESPRGNDLASRAARAAWLVSAALGAGHRVSGVPVSSKGSSAPQLLRIDGALYLATGAGLFLLSLVDLSDAARADVAERVRTASRPVVLARWPTSGTSAGRPRAKAV